MDGHEDKANPHTGKGGIQAGAGFEPATNGFAIRPPATGENTLIPCNCKALQHSGTNAETARAENALKTDPDLAILATAWPTLPAALKAGILAMVKAAR